MRRRQFVQSLTVLGLSQSIHFWQNPHPDARMQALAEPDLLHMTQSHDKVVALGKKYRQENRYDDSNSIISQMEQTLPLLPRSPEGIRARIRERIRLEFENDEWEIVDGWILSKMELKQCALYSFVHA